MSNILRTYTFFPWLRQGLATRINEVDSFGPANNPSERATVDICFKINNVEISKTVSLIGPGDIVGINPRTVVKTEPRDWITNFTPNNLAYIEFYDEDFPWRYTPARAAADRLRPWLVLVVVKDDEFKPAPVDVQLEDEKRKPAVAIEFANNAKLEDIFPPTDQSWAWAHVQTAEDVSENGTLTARQAVVRLGDLVKINPDQASSRILCPRKLKPDTAYQAMLIPAFEVGRLAGLGENTEGIDSLLPSWGNNQTKYPVYYQWYFRTAERGDFEYLVGLLDPKPVPDEVGIRDMDMQNPGFGVTPLKEPFSTMGLEGALRKPGTQSRPRDWPPAESSPDFLRTLSTKINMAADRLESPQDESHPDPVVTLPLYGRWHAMVDRVEVQGNGWTNELNTDPRLRTPAGFGTRVIQKNQEDYMKRSWEQVGDIIEANRKIRGAQLSIPTGLQILGRNLSSMPNAQVISLAGPVLARVMGSPTTIYRQVEESRLPKAALSPPFRAMTRSRGRIMKRVSRTGEQKPFDLVSGLNAGEITAALPKKEPDRAIRIEKIAAGIIPGWIPSWMIWLSRRPAVLLIILLLVALVSFVVAGAGTILSVMIGAVVSVGIAMAGVVRQVRRADSMRADGITAETLNSVPPRPSFVISKPGDVEAGGGSQSGSDSIDARDFRKAAFELAERLNIKAPKDQLKDPLDINNAKQKIVQALSPKNSLIRRLTSVTNVAEIYKPLKPVETVLEVMAHPSFADPMYKPLRNISSELLVPNLNKIPNNCISVLENNQRIIESYMVGLNHEMGRELLWREYPTDQRGTYFRQFWDVSDSEAGDTDPKIAEESLRDITPMYMWHRDSDLGSHQNRDLPTGIEDEAKIVLVVRGELLKKYPTTVVYAQKARWGIPDDPADPFSQETQEVRLLDESGDEGTVLTPAFRAEIEPDIHFFGFNLTVEEAKGSNNIEDGLPGWFTVLQQRPGEPTFGMDIAPRGAPPVIDDWNKLSWNHLGDIDALQTINLNTVPETDIPVSNPDKAIVWGSNAANMAYILYQDPSMVAFHISDMVD